MFELFVLLAFNMLISTMAMTTTPMPRRTTATMPPMIQGSALDLCGDAVAGMGDHPGVGA